MNLQAESTAYDLVFGKGPVLEVLENGNLTVNKIWISESLQDRDTKSRIVDFAKENKVPYFKVPLQKLDNLTKGQNHQGLVVSISPIKILSVAELIDSSYKLNKNTDVMLIAHEIEDTHNIGALIRTLVASGGSGVILTGRKNTGVNATIIKTSAGTVFQTKLARASNCSQVIKKLQDSGYWIVAADNSDDAQVVSKIDFPDKIAIIVGNEHEGLGDLVLKNSDFRAKIPISNKVDSLNVSVAFSIVLYEFLRQKNYSTIQI